ncbi:MAG: RHS repeat-associated core domain-containing protein, partial [Ignavibacteria bacterium]|nr:RHS repeat-associated core domain-containing protein [Ignavibacteria bacterium]
RSVIKPDSSIIEYKINASNQRIAKLKDGVIEKKWLYSGGLLPVAELDSADNIKVLYGPGYIVKGDTTYRVITNHLGSVKLIVNAATGEIVQNIDYDEFGNVSSLHNENSLPAAAKRRREFTDFGFAGGLYDAETGLTRFGARDYDASIGRWTAKDPIGFGGLQTNFYVYVNNAPIIYTDKIGLGRFGYRRLNLGLGWFNPPVLGGPIDEANNYMLAHEHYWYDNKDNTGYGGEGMFSEDAEEYSHYNFKDEYFDDNIMKQAIKNTQWSGDNYNVHGASLTAGVNCQDWADAARKEYYRLKKEMEDKNPCP